MQDHNSEPEVPFKCRAIARYLLVLIGSASFWAAACRAQTVSVWLTNDNQKTKLAQQSSITFAASSSSAPDVYVDETEGYQSIDGFGASFTDSAAYLLNEKVPSSQIGALMTNLFSRTSGIGADPGFELQRRFRSGNGNHFGCERRL